MVYNSPTFHCSPLGFLTLFQSEKRSRNLKPSQTTIQSLLFSTGNKFPTNKMQSQKQQPKGKGRASNRSRSNRGRAAGPSALPRTLNNNVARQFTDPKPIAVRRVGVSKNDPRLSKISGPMAEYYRQCVMPSVIDKSIVMPDPGGASVTSRHFSRVVSVPAAAFVNQQLSIVMTPNLTAPGYISSTPVSIPAVGTSAVALNGTFKFSPANTITKTLFTLSAIDGEGNTSTFPAFNVPTTTAPGVQIVQGGCDFFITIANTPNNPTSLILREYDAAGVGLVDHPLTMAAGVVATRQTFLNALTRWLGLIGVTGVDGVVLKFNAALSNAAIIPQAGDPFLGVAFAQQIIDKDITVGRVVSMSVLAHNTSNALQLGGNVTAGRVPHTFSPFDDVQTQIAKLPSNRKFQDVATDGAYTFWVPQILDEYFVDTIQFKAQQYADSEYILMKFEGMPVGATLMVQFDWIVEFYSPSQIWDKAPCPPLTPAFDALRYAVLQCDSSSANANHLELLKSLYGRGKKAVNQAMSHYSDNKEVYNGLASLLASLLV